MEYAENSNIGSAEMPGVLGLRILPYTSRYCTSGRRIASEHVLVA